MRVSCLLVICMLSLPAYSSSQYGDEAPSEAGSFFLFFVNSGMLLDLGDEAICVALSALNKAEYESLVNADAFTECREVFRARIHYAEEHHPFVSLVATVLGYAAFSPLAWCYYLLFYKPKNAKEIFLSTMKFEMVESGVAVVGQYLTDANLPIALLSLLIGVVSGLVRGGVLAMIYIWNTNPSFRYRSVVVSLSLAAFAAYGLFSVGEAQAGGAGGVLSKTFKAAADLPPVRAGNLVPEHNLRPGPGWGGGGGGYNLPPSYGQSYQPTFHIPKVTNEADFSRSQVFNANSHRF